MKCKSMAIELFDIVTTMQRNKNNQTTKNQARYYHFGDAQFCDGSKVALQIQSKIIGALQGKKKGARILDPDAVKW